MYTCNKKGLFTAFYAETVHVFSESVLSRQTGITQITLFVFSFLQTSVIKFLYIVLDDKRDNIIPQTFLEKDKPADSAVSVLKGVYTLEIIMELQKLVKAFLFV